MQLSDPIYFDSEEKTVSSISDQEYMPESQAESTSTQSPEYSPQSDNEYVASSQASLIEEYFSEDSFVKSNKRKKYSKNISRLKIRKSSNISLNREIKRSNFKQKGRNRCFSDENESSEISTYDSRKTENDEASTSTDNYSAELSTDFNKPPILEIKYDAIERVVKRRNGKKGEIGSETSIYNSLIDKYIEKNDYEDTEEQFLIKWRFKSYIHCTWENRESLNLPTIKGFKKIDNLYKKDENQEFFEYGISGEVEESIVDYTCVERIIAGRYQESQIRQPEYLCKWRSLQYEDSTWETKDIIDKLYALQLQNYEDHQHNYIYRFNSNQLSLKYDKSELFSFIDELNKNNDSLKMRDYQIEGAKWLMRSACVGKGAILADEMGLGKTVQIIKYIEYFDEFYGVKGPSLIIVPLSTIDNWCRHFSIWARRLYIIPFTGTIQSRDIIKTHEIYDLNYNKLKFNVIITTYELVFKETEFFSSINWFSLIIDEGHRIKNENSLLYKCLFNFNSFQRVLVTGTPLQNSLRELYALLHFINPYKFSEPDTIERFSEYEDKHVGYEQLKLFISDYILRRTKKDVEKSLPAKVEQILRVDMTNMQKKYYKMILTKNYEELAKEARGSVGGFLNIIMELKKCCNHTLLVNKEISETDINQFLIGSGKLILLDKLLSRLYINKNRVLIFSQMVTMLDILSQYLNLRGFQFQRLDGSVCESARVRAINHFNAPDSADFCFLLSTKAGGLGINLVTADTVIIYDSDWNPQNDLQAQARAHRIGQKKQVKIYRLVTKFSIEENIIERAKRKMVLDHLVIQTMDSKLSGISSNTVRFSREELALILKFGAEELFKENIVDGVPEPLQEMDLDDIIQISDPNDPDLPIQSRGEEFLSSFKVANFNTEEIERDLDQEFKWKNIMPKEVIEKAECAKIQAFQAEIDLPPRRKLQINTIVSESDSYDESKTYFPDIKSRDLKKFLRTYFKFCKSCNRVKDILKHCKIEESDLPAYEQISMHIESSYNRKDSPSIIKINKTPFDLTEFKYLRSITDTIGEKVSKYVTEKGNTNNFALNIIKCPKPKWNRDWNKSDDANLFIGIYLYGMENWKAITSDINLGLSEKLKNSRHKVPTSLIYEHLLNIIKLLKKNENSSNKSWVKNKEARKFSSSAKQVVKKTPILETNSKSKTINYEQVDENVIKKCAKVLSSIKKNIHNIEGVTLKGLLRHKEDLKKIGNLIYSDKIKSSKIDPKTLWNFVFRFTSLSSTKELISFYNRKIQNIN